MMTLPWTKSLEDAWLLGRKQGRAPHAVLLQGPAGAGKRCVAAWMAKSHLDLCMDKERAVYPLQVPEHADMRWISPPEDKHAIGIDQIRNLVSEMGLTSYEGSGKVAVIEPANAMTISAANSLLKTLEEPAGNALLILIADRVGNLPATIFSRCQRLTIDLPGEQEALNWLEQIKSHKRWAKLLHGTGNLPIAALHAAESEGDTDILATDFAAVLVRRASPLEVASRWSRMDTAMVFRWLSRRVAACIRQTFQGKEVGSGGNIDHSVLQRMDRRNLFCYLDTINGLINQPAGSYNELLTLESLLIDWADGLKNHKELGRLDNIGMLAGQDA